MQPSDAIGKSVEQIETPALLVDLDKLQRNLDKMAQFSKENAIPLRPHVKCHKCVELAKLQIQAWVTCRAFCGRYS